MIIFRPPHQITKKNTYITKDKKNCETDDTSPLLILIAQKLYKTLESPVHTVSIILNLKMCKENTTGNFQEETGRPTSI